MQRTTRTVSLLLVALAIVLAGCAEDRPRPRHSGSGGEVSDEPDLSAPVDEGEPWDGFCGYSSQERECDLVGSCRMQGRLRECYLTEQVGNEHVCRYENPEHYLDGMPCITIAECLAGWTATGRGPEEVADLCDPDFVFVPPAAYPD